MTGNHILVSFTYIEDGERQRESSINMMLDSGNMPASEKNMQFIIALVTTFKNMSDHAIKRGKSTVVPITPEEMQQATNHIKDIISYQNTHP